MGGERGEPHAPLLDRLLRARNSQHRGFIDLIPHRVFIKDRNSVYLYCNENYARDLGIRPDEIIGKTDFDILDQELAERYREFDRDVLSEGIADRWEMRHLAAGDRTWIRLSVAPLRDDSGEIVALIGISEDMTVLKAAQLALSEQELFSDSLIESLPGVFYVFDQARRFLRWNRNLEELTGLSREQMRMSSALDTIHPEDRPLIESKIEEAFDAGYAEAEARLLNRNGSARQHFFTGKRVEIGGQRYVLGTGIDICERVAMEQALRESEQQFRTILDHTPIGMAVVTLEGHFVEVNRRLCEILGRDREELVGRRIHDVTHPDDVAPNLDLLHRLRDGEVTAYQMDKRYVHKDGHVVWAQLSVAPLLDANGKPIHAIGQTWDITENRRAEQALRTSEASLSAILDNLPYRVWLKDVDGRYLAGNQLLVRSTGLGTIEEILGKSDLDLWPSELAEKYRADDAAVMASRRQVFTEELSLDNGIMHWVETFKAPVLDHNGDLLGTTGFARDITARKFHEQALRQSEERFQALFQGVQDAVFVHEVFADRGPGTFLEVNDAACKLLGYSCEELFAMSPRDIDATTAGVDTMSLWERVAAGESVVFERVFRARDDTLIPVEIHASPFHLQGRLAVFSLARDIRERRRSEEQLRTLARRQKAILDNIPDLAWLKDADSRFIMVNSALEQAFGVCPGEIAGKRDTDFVPAEIAALYRSDDCEVMSSRKGKRVIEPWQNKNGRRAWIETIKAPIFDEDGQVVGTTGIARDVTERKAVEDQLRLLAKVFESSSEAIVITDEANKIVAVNAAFTGLTGYGAEEVLGRNPAMLSAGHESGEFFREMWDAIRQTGHWQGEIWDRRKDGAVYPKWLNIDVLHDDEGNVTHYIGAFSDISERKANEEQIRHLAQHDILTGLPNRVLFADRLEQAIANAHRNERGLALLFIDLDHFKDINDSLGHHVGDLLLQEVAARLQAQLRASDVVCRQGGDEFILILQDIHAPEEAAHIANKLVTSVSLPVRLGGEDIIASASIGIALFPADGDDGLTLIRNADTAMYHAKQSGRGQYQFFVQELNQAVHQRLAIEKGLRRALKNREFVLHYQPQMDLASGTVIGAEALIRWNHPEQGLVPPARFIGIAEECALIVPIGEWVLREACRQAVAWSRAGLPDLVVAVNLSAVQFKRSDLVNSVTAALAESGLDPARLELELTESILIQDTDVVLGTVHRIKALGVKLSIDDFGTGYSSLAYLKRFAVDKLKIDQSFIRDMADDPNDAAIVHAIIQMARSLNLRTIAEGVENERQLTSLRLQHCDEVQGYHFARPLEAEEFVRHLVPAR